MLQIKRALFTIILLLINGLHSSALFAEVKQNETNILIMGTSDGPPYMIQETESGLDIDIPRAALNRVGFSINMEFYPLSRAIHELQLKRINLTAPFFTAAPEGIFVSDPHIEYRPSVITLDSIENMSTLNQIKRYSIATFQGATGYFGEVFYNASLESPDYVENHSMEKLIDLLMTKRYQVIVLDYWIFHFFLSKSQYSSQLNKVRFHELLPRVPAAVAFNNEALRDQFNQGLRMIKDDGTYDEIINRYQRND